MPLAKLVAGGALWQFAIRACAGGLALVANLFIARHLDLAQIAYYFLFGTLAYFGSALFYVGANIFLQRQFLSLATDNTLDGRFLVRFIGVTAAVGTVAVTTASCIYLFALHYPAAVFSAIACALLSTGTYFSGAARELLALSGRVGESAGFYLAEQVVKLILFTAILFRLPNAGAASYVLAAAAASMLAGAGGVAHLIAKTERTRMLTETRATDIASTMLPIGISGLLNWLQLQSYRPLLIFMGVPAQVIGTTSLMTVLGATGANPALTVVTQNFLPRIYRREIDSIRTCIWAVVAVASFLAVMSIPAGYVFLLLSRRQQLMIYLPLVAIGVFVEAANSIVGTFQHACNVSGEPLWRISVATGVGAAVAIGAAVLPLTQAAIPYGIGFGLLASQLVVMWIIGRDSMRARLR